MQRDVEQFVEHVYDVLIIGGGIYGACVAWDAALRGLSVALVEKGDFGHATSFNSLKVIHGGLRYLQHLDINRIRVSIRERRIWMRIAPHLVHPLPFVMPTYGHGLHGRESVALALALHDLMGWNRNHGQKPDKYLPRGQVISPSACRQLLPGLGAEHLTGGAVWYDCQMHNSERLLLDLLKSAVEAGAHVANYVDIRGFIQKDNRVVGVKVRDRLTQADLDIRAQMVVNTGGPWVPHLWELLNGQRPYPTVRLSKAINLVVDRLPLPEYAVGIPSKKPYRDPKARLHKGTRLLFIVPWRDYSLVGTTHVPFQGEPDAYAITEDEVASFLAEINDAYPGAGLTREAVRFVYGGLLPMQAAHVKRGEVSLTKRYRIYDHQHRDHIGGLISVIGVKYTEARHVAEKVVDGVCAKLGRSSRRCQTATTPVYGGHLEHFETFLQQTMACHPSGLRSDIVCHLVSTYGAAYSKILQYLQDDPELGGPLSPEASVLKAELLHAIHEEMAVKLTDVVLRRTELGLCRHLSDEDLYACARIMAAELSWGADRVHQEVTETNVALAGRVSQLMPPCRDSSNAERTALATQDVSEVFEKTAES